jgi:hypothetical protein
MRRFASGGSSVRRTGSLIGGATLSACRKVGNQPDGSMEMTRIFLPLSELTGRVLSLGSLSISGVGLLVCFEPAIVARHALPGVDRACDVLCVRPARDSQLILAFLQRFELVADRPARQGGADIPPVRGAPGPVLRRTTDRGEAGVLSSTTRARRERRRGGISFTSLRTSFSHDSG